MFSLALFRLSLLRHLKEVGDSTRLEVGRVESGRYPSQFFLIFFK